MDDKTIEFKKAFARQMAFLEEKDFPQEVIGALWQKEEAVKAKVCSYETMPVFVPVIPEASLSCIQQVLRFVFFSHSEKNESIMYQNYLNGFFYNIRKAWNSSDIREPGFMIDVRCKKLSELEIPPKSDGLILDQILRQKLSDEGYIPANHVESFAIACMTDLLPKDGSARFCAVNFSWDGHGFAMVFPGSELKYGLDWCHPTFKMDGTFWQDDRDTYEMLVPMFKEFV